MKFLISFSFLLTAFSIISCQHLNKIYIVRHAEKAAEPASDPVLTAEGMARAEALKDYFKDKSILALFSTQKQRTIATLTPLSNLKHLPITYYGNDTLNKFLEGVIRIKKNTLIAGHSNTSVTMLSHFNLPHTIKYIPEDDYDNLFIIEVKNGKAIKIIETTYGASSPVKK